MSLNFVEVFKIYFGLKLEIVYCDYNWDDFYFIEDLFCYKWYDLKELEKKK